MARGKKLAAREEILLQPVSSIKEKPTMPKIPLATDMVHNGVIYLRGETEYPDLLDEALRQKANSVKMVQDHPIFVSPSKRVEGFNPFAQHAAPIQPVGPQLSVPQPPTPPAPPLPAIGDDAELPEDFPARDELISAGYDTIGKVKDVPDLKEIEGIGPTTEAEIQAALAENELQSSEVMI